jgi:glycosyltransferase involved in cell wall biosynthesis
MDQKTKLLLCIFPKKVGGEYLATKAIVKGLSQNKKIECRILEIKNFHWQTPSGRLRLLRNFLTNVFITVRDINFSSEIFFRPNIIIYSPSIMVLCVLMLKNRKNCKYLYHFHGFDYGEGGKSLWEYLFQEKETIVVKYLYLLPFLLFHQWVERWVVSNVWKVIVPTSYSLKILRHRYKSIDSTKIFIVPNGYDATIFSFRPKKRKRIHTLLYSGRLVREKGIIEMINAFLKLPKSCYKLIIAHPIPEDIFFEKIVYNKIKNQSNIILVRDPSQQKIAWLYHQADLSLILSTSFFEQLPLSFLESLATGTPVFTSSKVEGVKDMQNKIGGLIVDDLSAKNIEISIIKYFENSEKNRRKIELRSQQIGKKYSWDRSISLLENVLNN